MNKVTFTIVKITNISRKSVVSSCLKVFLKLELDKVLDGIGYSTC